MYLNVTVMCQEDILSFIFKDIETGDNKVGRKR